MTSRAKSGGSHFSVVSQDHTRSLSRPQGHFLISEKLPSSSRAVLGAQVVASNW